MLSFSGAVREDQTMGRQPTEGNQGRGAVRQRDSWGGDLRLEETSARFRKLRQPVRGRVGEGASPRAEADGQGEAQPLQI